jgi:DNA ligase-1
MLAVSVEDLNSLRYPKMVSPKLDGIRCLVVNGQAVSRKLKPIPNNHIRNMIETHLPDGIDGELLIPGKTFNEIQSAVMSIDGQPYFEFHAFDYVTEVNQQFNERYNNLVKLGGNLPNWVIPVTHWYVYDPETIREWEEKFVSYGHEGLMIRCPFSPYKAGRSTLKEEYLLKVKRWQDAEATIIGFEEQMHNTNEAEINELGHVKRSTAQSGMVGAATLGKLIVKDATTGLELVIGTGEGLTKELRQEIWNNQEKYVGRVITYKFQPSGMKDLPRFPIWKGFRLD